MTLCRFGQLRIFLKGYLAGRAQACFTQELLEIALEGVRLPKLKDPISVTLWPRDPHNVMQ